VLLRPECRVFQQGGASASRRSSVHRFFHTAERSCFLNSSVIPNPVFQCHCQRARDPSAFCPQFPILDCFFPHTSIIRNLDTSLPPSPLTSLHKDFPTLARCIFIPARGFRAVPALSLCSSSRSRRTACDAELARRSSVEILGGVSLLKWTDRRVFRMIQNSRGWH
jgi:hypothetical protein